jgi:hypothetical protein
MSDEYIYCFSNSSMSNILKIGMTERTPESRLTEANTSDTWRPPTSYILEFAKKVSNAREKEKTLHDFLSHKRVTSFLFEISKEEARKYFDLMDGEMIEGSSPIKEKYIPCKKNVTDNE